MRVDAHQHFWRYSVEEFGWINDSMSAIRRDFLPSDLRVALSETGIEATVAVQACQTIEETNWLLQLAEEHPWIAGVVGWLPLTSPRIDQVLEEFSANAKLKGVRHVLQAEPDSYMEREDFNTGIKALAQYALTYDLLVLQHQLPAAIRFVDRHPNQPIVLDHLAKPLIVEHALDPWRIEIRELAKRPNVTCKISGMVTEADFKSWKTNDLHPYLETALEAFGPQRLLFGSDWPVCTVAATYSQWVNVVQSFVAHLSSDEQEQILGRNAATVYRLS